MANNMMNSIKQKQHKRERQRETVTTGDLNELSEKEIKSIIMVKDENLIDDPNNEETYGEYEIDALAEDMKFEWIYRGDICLSFFKKYRRRDNISH